MAALIKIDHSFMAAAERSDHLRFCSRCGEPAEEPPLGERPLVERRVCQACGMGMLLRCMRAALPGARAAFLVVRHDMRVSAMSVAGERLFGPEPDVVGAPLSHIVQSPLGDDQLMRAVGRAALRQREPVVMPVKGATEKAAAEGMLAARISTCGPPRAALVTVEPSGFGRR